jgi:hypothetical protein
MFYFWRVKGYRYFLLLTIMIARSSELSAQYSDSAFYRINATASGSLNKTNDQSSYLLNNALRFGVRKKSIALNWSNTWVYGQQQNALTNNDYSGTFDCNLYKTFPRFYYWALATYTTSYSLKINNQGQFGLGIAYSIVDTAELYLNISNGIIYEESDIVLSDTTRERYNTFRNSLRLSARWTTGEIFTIGGAGFLQNSLQYSNDYIIKANLSADLRLRTWLSLKAAVTYNKISRTARENFLFTYGIAIDKYF